MKKEVIIAIIGGFVLGLIITFGIATAQRSLNNRPPRLTTDTTTPLIPSPSPPQHNLFITSPQNNSPTHESKLMVSGSTTGGSMISLISTNSQNTTVTDAQGNFSLPIELDLGVNLLNLNSYDPQGNVAQANLNVVYIPLNLNPTPTPIK